MSTALLKRLAALEQRKPTATGPDDAALCGAFGELLEALRVALPGDPWPKGGFPYGIPRGFRLHHDRHEELIGRIVASATTEDDRRLLEALPAGAVRIVAGALRLPDDPAVVLRMLHEVADSV